MTRKAKKTVGVNGDTLKVVREAAGVSGAALSAKIGRNRSWASSVESGRYALTESDAAAVCEALGVSLECFGIKEGAGASVLKFRPEVMVEAARARGWSIRHLAQLIGSSFSRKISHRRRASHSLDWATTRASVAAVYSR